MSHSKACLLYQEGRSCAVPLRCLVLRWAPVLSDCHLLLCQGRSLGTSWWWTPCYGRCLRWLGCWWPCYYRWAAHHLKHRIQIYTPNLQHSTIILKDFGCICIPMSWKAFKASLVSSTLRINHSKGSESWHVDREPCKINANYYTQYISVYGPYTDYLLFICWWVTPLHEWWSDIGKGKTGVVFFIFMELYIVLM